jgi:uncharacterized membrane protein (DUF4010 family)
MELTPPIILIVSFLIGGLIGLERQFNETGTEGNNRVQIAIVGVRTFSLIGTLGAITGLVFSANVLLAGFIAVTFLALLLLYYIQDSKHTLAYGITTELAMVYTFLLGILVAQDIFPIQLILAITVVLLLLLSKKERIQSFIDKLSHSELNAFISYAIVALVILPFLPNEMYALADVPFIKNLLIKFDFPAEKVATIDLFNPFKTWLIVALITGIDILGYFLERTFGSKRGWLLASIAGGFISSTATTQSLAQQSKETKYFSPLIAAALVANTASFFQIAVVLLAVNSSFFLAALPSILLLTMSGIVTAGYFLFKPDKNAKKDRTFTAVKTHEIFNLSPALKFALLFLIINIVSKLSLLFLGNSGFLATTAIGALAGLDAVMINTAELAGRTIDHRLGVIAFLTANAVNLIAKSVYSFFQGERSFARQISLSFFIIILSSIAGLLFL